MNILIINGSPKGKDSTTLYTSLYLEKLNPGHEFRVIHAARKIRAYENDFSGVHEELLWADIIVFSYPVYTFLVPYQLYRFIELIKASGIDISGKYATQISTSMHFYDVTAHEFIRENCLDMGLKYIRGLSAGMDDLTCEKGRRQAEDFFAQIIFCAEHGIYESGAKKSGYVQKEYVPTLGKAEKTGKKRIAVLSSVKEDDGCLKNMLADFENATENEVKLIELNKYPFSGGCLGCLECAINGKCVYKDGFEDYLRNEINTCDAFIYAFNIENHYMPSSFKLFDDRQFCNGHRTVTTGKPAGYIICGDIENEHNLKTVIEARSEVGGNFLCGIAADTGDTAKNISELALTMDTALKKGWSRPMNFYGTGGTKIFRDLIFMMRGIMREDHRFYKKHGIYDFPHKQRGKILLMQLAGAMLRNPSVKKKMGGKLSGFMTMPYKKVLDDMDK